MSEQKSPLKVLWISPVMTGEGNRLFGQEESPTGGWTQNLWNNLTKRKDLAMAVVAPAKIKSYEYRTGEDGSMYFSFPKTGNLKTDLTTIRHIYMDISKRFKPDVIHLHGTEYPYGAEWVRIFGPKNVVVSIQGLLTAYTRYYLGGIPENDFPLTLRDLLKMDTPVRQAKSFARRGLTERWLLEHANHVIGRTSWDRAHALAINPAINYHYGGETLRPIFYTAKWRYENCQPHTIFLSQGYYPIKGLHKVIEALPLVAREFPDVKVRLSGSSPFGSNRWRIGGYGVYLQRLMKKLGVEDRVEAIGLLSAEEMCREFLNANLFLLPSAIENSPNSLGEAQVLEMPYLASIAGGTPDLCKDNPEALYRFEETEMLAQKICDIFRLGAEFRPTPAPLYRYDAERNVSDLIATYNKVYLF